MTSIFLLLIAAACVIADSIVEIPDGKIKGQVATSYGGKKYTEFLGIPYAKPPVGKLRFKDPEPNDPWCGVWPANASSTCCQVIHNYKPEGGITTGVEDCLHINVFVPLLTTPKKLDVIVFIHGGAFAFGGYGFAGPTFLMDRGDVVLVSFNYRVGIFGFLSTGDKFLPGNMGMKDQVLALKWTRKNIKHFGGNEKSVTITGLSAGGASVHYHYLSPLSRGLFDKGISGSGCALNPWTFQEKPLQKAKIVGESLGCVTNSTKELVKCITSRPFELITNSIRLLRTWLFNPFSPVALVVDKASKNPFLPEHPYKVLSDKNVYDVPWIATTVTSEGLYPAAEFVTKEKHLKDLSSNWEVYAPAIMHYSETIQKSVINLASQRIKSYYLGNKDINRNSFSELVQMIGDRLFITDIETSARLHSKAVDSPVYLYSWDYLSEKRESLYSHYTNISSERLGVGHGDDMLFVFAFITDGIPEKMTVKDEQMKEFLLDVYTSFAKTGNPCVTDWTPVCKNGCQLIDYLHIGRNQERENRKAAELGHRSFWESLPFRENARLFTTE